MKFSIIIPAHNSEQYIRKCLDSIKQQTFTDYELIIVCDNCTDNTEQVAREYTSNVERVGFGRDGMTRNVGISRAKGDWLLFLDDDDWWLHEYVLQQLHDKLEENPGIDVLCFSFIFKGWKYATPTGQAGNRHWTAVWNKCWRREFVKDCKFSNEWSVSDVQFHNQVFNKKPRVLDWDMPMYYYNYMRVGSQTERNSRTGI